MKYKVSVIKKIAFLVMTMALAVAMVACQRRCRAQPGEPGRCGTSRDQREKRPLQHRPIANYANVTLNRWPRWLSERRLRPCSA